MDRTMCHYVEHPDRYGVPYYEAEEESVEEGSDDDAEFEDDFEDDFEEAEDVRIVADGGDE